MLALLKDREARSNILKINVFREYGFIKGE